MNSQKGIDAVRRLNEQLRDETLLKSLRARRVDTRLLRRAVRVRNAEPESTQVFPALAGVGDALASALPDHDVVSLIATLVGPSADGGMAGVTVPETAPTDPAATEPRQAREDDESSSSGPVVDSDPVRADLTRGLADELAAKLGLSTYRVQVDEVGAALASQHGAPGVVIDDTAYLDPAGYDPRTGLGRELLAHELTHLAQKTLEPPTESRQEAIAAAEAEALAAGQSFAAGGSVEPPSSGLPPGYIATGLTEDAQVKELFNDFFHVSGLRDAGGGVWEGTAGIAIGGPIESLGSFAISAKLKDEPGSATGWRRWDWVKAEKTIAPFGEDAGSILVESTNTGSAKRVDVTVSCRNMELPGLAPVAALQLKKSGVTSEAELSDLTITAQGRVDLDTSTMMGKMVQRGHVVDPTFTLGTRRLNATGEVVLKLPGIQENTGAFQIVDNVVGGTFDFASKRFSLPSTSPIVDGDVTGRLTIANNAFAGGSLKATTGVDVAGVPDKADLLVWDLAVDADGNADFAGRLTSPVDFAWANPASPIEDLTLAEMRGELNTGSSGSSLELHSRINLKHSKTRLGDHAVDDNSFVFDYNSAGTPKVSLSAQDPLRVRLIDSGKRKLSAVVDGLRFSGPSLAAGSISFTSGRIDGRAPVVGKLTGDLLQTDSLNEFNADLNLDTGLCLPSKDAALLTGTADSAVKVRKGAFEEGSINATMNMAMPGGLDPVAIAAKLHVAADGAFSAGVNTEQELELVGGKLALTRASLTRSAEGAVSGDLSFRVGPSEGGWDISETFDASKGLTNTPTEQTNEDTARSPYRYSYKAGFSLSQGFYADGRFSADMGPMRVEGMGRISQAALLGEGADLQFGFVGDLTQPKTFTKKLLTIDRKKIPIAAWGNLAGVFAEAGADIGVQGQLGAISVDGGGIMQGVLPWGPFAKRATAKVNVRGAASGSVVGGPTLGLGAWVAGGLLSMSGGLKMPLTATLAANLMQSTTLNMTDSGLASELSLSAPLVFAMGGAAIPYFDFTALGGAIKSGAKEGSPLATLMLVEPTKVCDFGVDLKALLTPGETATTVELPTDQEITRGDASSSGVVPDTEPVPSQGTVKADTSAPTDQAPPEFGDTTELWQGLQTAVGQEPWFQQLDTLRVLLEKVGSIISVGLDQLETFVKWVQDHAKVDLASVSETFWSNVEGFVADFTGDSYLDVVRLVKTIAGAYQEDVEDGSSGQPSVDLNGALETLEAKLQELPGVGPSKAAAIKAHRAGIERFRDTRELLDVSGIGKATFDRIEPLVTLGSPVEEATPSTKKDVNTVDQPGLEAIDGIGPKLAAAILTHRGSLPDGRFTTIEQLLGVPGVGPARLSGLQKALQVGTGAAPSDAFNHQTGEVDLTLNGARIRAQVLTSPSLQAWFAPAGNTLRDDLVLQEFQGDALSLSDNGKELSGELIASIYLKGLGTLDGLKLPVSSNVVEPRFSGAPFRRGEILAGVPVPATLSGGFENLPNALTQVTFQKTPEGAGLPPTIAGISLASKKPIQAVFDRADGETWRLHGMDGLLFGDDSNVFSAQLMAADWSEQAGFSAIGQVAAKLGSLGSAVAQLSIANNKLEALQLGLESNTVNYPTSSPLVTAQVMGQLQVGQEEAEGSLSILASLPALPSAPSARADVSFDKDLNPSWKAGLTAPVPMAPGVTLSALEFGEKDRAFWASGAGVIGLAGLNVAAKVAYDSGGLEFTATGDVTVPGLRLSSFTGGYGPSGLTLGGAARFGAVPGFGPIDATFRANGQRAVFSSSPVETSESPSTRQPIKLSLNDLTYDMGTGGFSGGGSLEGIVPMVGLVRGSAELADGAASAPEVSQPPPVSGDSTPSSPEVMVHLTESATSAGSFGSRLKLKKGSLEIANDRLRVPDATPFVWGQLDAHLDYEDGKVNGAVNGKDMRVDLPGVGRRALRLTGQAKDNVYSGEITLAEQRMGSKSWLTLKSLTGAFDGNKPEHPWGFGGAIGVNLGTTETNMGLKYAAGVLSATGAVKFGERTESSRFWGEVAATYDSSRENAFGFRGSVDARLSDNVSGKATLSYADSGGDPDAPPGVDATLALNPTPVVGPSTNPRPIAGPWAADFPLAALAPVPITLFGSLGGSVALDYGSERGIQLAGTASIQGIRKNESSERGGLTFDSAQVQPIVSGDLFASLEGGPSIGIGAALIYPKIASVQGSLGLPLKMKAQVTPKLEGELRYRQGEMDGGAAISAPLCMSAAIEPTLSLHGTALGYTKRFADLSIGKWPLMKPKKIMDFRYELGRLHGPKPALEGPTGDRLEDAAEAEEPTNQQTAVEERTVPTKDSTPSGSLAASQGGAFDLVSLKDQAVSKLAGVKDWLSDKWALIERLGSAIMKKARAFAHTANSWLRVGADYAGRLANWARFWRSGAEQALTEANDSGVEFDAQPDLKEFDGFDVAKFQKDGAVRTKIGNRARQRGQNAEAAMREWDNYAPLYLPLGAIARLFGRGGRTHEREAQRQRGIQQTARETRERFESPIAQARAAMEDGDNTSQEFTLFYRFMLIAGRSPIPAVLPVLTQGFETVTGRGTPVADALMAASPDSIDWIFFAEGDDSELRVVTEYLKTVEKRRPRWFRQLVERCGERHRETVTRRLSDLVPGLSGELADIARLRKKTQLRYTEKRDSDNRPYDVCISTDEEKAIAKFENWALRSVEEVLDRFEALTELTPHQRSYVSTVTGIRDVSPGQEVMSPLLGLATHALRDGDWKSEAARERPVTAGLHKAGPTHLVWKVFKSNGLPLTTYLKEVERPETHHIRQALDANALGTGGNSTTTAAVDILNRHFSGLKGQLAVSEKLHKEGYNEDTDGRRSQYRTRGSEQAITSVDHARDRFNALSPPSNEQRTFMGIVERLVSAGIGVRATTALAKGADSVLSGGDGSFARWAAGKPLKTEFAEEGAYDAPFLSALADDSSGLFRYLQDHEKLTARDFRQLVTAGGRLKQPAARALERRVTGLREEIAFWNTLNRDSREQIKSADRVFDDLDKLVSPTAAQQAYGTWLKVELKERHCKGAVRAMLDGSSAVLQGRTPGPRISHLYPRDDSEAWNWFRRDGKADEYRQLKDYIEKVERNPTGFETMLRELVPKYSNFLPEYRRYYAAKHLLRIFPEYRWLGEHCRG